MDKNEQNKRLIEAIQEAIDAKRVSRVKLSEMAGRSTNYIGQVLRGETVPKIDTVVAICQALDISPLYILTGHNITPETENFISLFSKLDADAQADAIRFLERMARHQ